MTPPAVPADAAAVPLAEATQERQGLGGAKPDAYETL